MDHELGGLLFSRERNNTHLMQLSRLVQPHLAEAKRHAGTAEPVAESFVKLERADLVLGVMCTIASAQFIVPAYRTTGIADNASCR
jgi:LysR family hydrogen peroxide-inducible transcriptional activator